MERVDWLRVGVGRRLMSIMTATNAPQAPMMMRTAHAQHLQRLHGAFLRTGAVLTSFSLASIIVGVLGVIDTSASSVAFIMAAAECDIGTSASSAVGLAAGLTMVAGQPKKKLVEADCNYGEAAPWGWGG